MREYCVITDSGCDIRPALLKDWGIELIDLTFRFEGEDREYSNAEMESIEFYRRMREGGHAKTSAINPEGFQGVFEEKLMQGRDILYLGFSSGLSATCGSAQIAREELLGRYPDRKIFIVDTLAASAGQGLCVYLVAEKVKMGASIEEAADCAQALKQKIAHWFTVDDLVYLKRGGRISSAAALVGKTLNIKPVLHVDDEGKLISMQKARGRKKALTALADKYEELMEDTEGPVFVSHADCADEVRELEMLFQARFGKSFDVVTDIGPVIGAHAGPGTIALFFIGRQR